MSTQSKLFIYSILRLENRKKRFIFQASVECTLQLPSEPRHGVHSLNEHNPSTPFRIYFTQSCHLSKRIVRDLSAAHLIRPHTQNRLKCTSNLSDTNDCGQCKFNCMSQSLWVYKYSRELTIFLSIVVCTEKGDCVTNKTCCSKYIEYKDVSMHKR